MKRLKEIWIRGAVAAVALGLIGVMAVMNISLAFDPLRDFACRRKSFRKTVSAIAANYSSDELWFKNNCVTLNGAFARLTGRRVYNEVTLMNNGMLTNVSSPKGNRASDASIQKTSERFTDFADFLKELNIPFLFVLAPSKLPLTGDVLPAGANANTHENTDRLLASLNANGVHTLDLRPMLAKDVADVEKNFYRTDHHWNNDASVASLIPIMEGIEGALGTTLDKGHADPQAWERHVKGDWSLGSHGKRVGPWFAGVDPLIWYTPQFETDISYCITSGSKMDKGAFADACIDSKCITKKDYYGMSNYCLYGKNYALARFRNEGAPNDKRVLFIHDSFGTSTMAFLSTMFTEVDAVDPRNFKNATVAQYAEWTRPDVVLILLNPSGVKPCAVKYGGAECLERMRGLESGTLLEADALEDGATQGALPFRCAPGDTCHLSIGDVEVRDGDACFAVVELFDKAKDKKAGSAAFDIDYCRARGAFSWDFIAPSGEGDLELRFYTCANGGKRSGTARFSDIRLTRDIPSNPVKAG